jgi:hypothetical protein
MSASVDTSALVKSYVVEVGSVGCGKIGRVMGIFSVGHCSLGATS